MPLKIWVFTSEYFLREKFLAFISALDQVFTKVNIGIKKK